jgi:hypothetical protein
MATNKTELRLEIQDFGQHEVETLSDQELDTAISRAQRHLSIEADLDSPSWYSKPLQEDALFWTSMLFTKVITGALDSKAVAVGGIDEGELLAKSEDEVTTWYRNYENAKERLRAEENERGGGTSRSARTTIGGDRRYTRD